MQLHAVALAGAGTAIAGVGFGASVLACFGTLARLAAPAERGELFAVAYVLAYLAFSLPAVAAGLASTAVGLHATAVAYSLGVVALGLTALAAQRGRRAAAPPYPSRGELRVRGSERIEPGQGQLDPRQLAESGRDRGPPDRGVQGGQIGPGRREPLVVRGQYAGLSVAGWE